ncbi:hypothetical protein Pst134EA_021482 [Puccinia striiformis f. sp. tritici]|uniref:hypothetical protein n=1 Tax=Puccinia striiformis f. sp. tritici TaxID=168172 RepID=UPI0020087139|nr:hypothetical protein Pst134EA_021482 [Puccinia striiformis f. sp. tritici]KAH9457607.1 hypothetical protein Pst134EA_021482 [Puccinia striiformis f. sp. tritici]
MRQWVLVQQTNLLPIAIHSNVRPLPSSNPRADPHVKSHQDFTLDSRKDGSLRAAAADCKQHRVNFNARQMHKYPVCHVLDNSPNFLAHRARSDLRNRLLDANPRSLGLFGIEPQIALPL